MLFLLPQIKVLDVRVTFFLIPVLDRYTFLKDVTFL